MSDLVAYVDGGSLGNPGPSGIGVVIDGYTDGTIRIVKWIRRQDNNVAEYVALLEALQCALGLNAKTLHVFSDSEVIAKQNEGRVPLPQPEALLPELDLPEIGPVARFLDLTRPAREQHRGEQSGQFSCPQRGMMAQPSFSHHLGMSVR
jgi:hypothetical protein